MKTISMAKGFRKYDYPFIMSVLDTLFRNDDDINKTVYETGVHKDTLERWIDKYSTEYHAQRQLKAIDKAFVQSSPSIEQMRKSAADELDYVKDMILTKMKEVIPHTKNLDQLSRAYKTLYECQNGIKDGNLPQDKSFLNIFNLQINAMQGKMEGEETKDIEYEPTDD